MTGQAAFACAAPTTTGFSVQGGHAEYMVVGADETVLLPDGLPFELAAPMLCAGYTGWSALRAGDPQPHERVAVLGIGAVGHLAVQFAHACGLETIAMTSSADKHDVVRRLGADEVVANGAELRAAGGADVILATGKSYPAAAEALTGLRPGGRLVLSGIDPTAPFTVPPAGRGLPFIGTRMQVIGSTHNGPQYLREALDLAAAGKVTPWSRRSRRRRWPRWSTRSPRAPSASARWSPTRRSSGRRPRRLAMLEQKPRWHIESGRGSALCSTRDTAGEDRNSGARGSRGPYAKTAELRQKILDLRGGIRAP